MTRYEERLVAPPSWWGAGVAVALMLAAGVHGGASGPRAVVPYLVLPLLVLVALALSSRGRIRVADGVLHVPRARIPLTHLGGVTALDREQTRRVRGPLAEPRAFVATRVWLPRAVRLQVEDPGDDTPYWLVGTRKPEALAAALHEERSGGPTP